MTKRKSAACDLRTTPFRRPTVLATIVLVAASTLALTGHAQNTEQEDTFHGVVEVPLVNVDVFVTDGRGQPVAGLTADDFELLVDGKPVGVSHFYAAPAVESAPPEEGATAPPEPAPVQQPERAAVPPEQDLSVIIYVDQTNLDLERRRTAFENLETFIREKLPAGLPVMMLDFNGKLRVCQEFTTDRDELLAALGCSRTTVRGRLDLAKETALLKRRINQVASQRPPVTDVDGYQRWKDDVTALHETIKNEFASFERDQAMLSLEGLRKCVGFVSSLPGRKALFFMSDGVTVRPSDQMAQYWRGVFVTAATADRDLRRQLDRSASEAHKSYGPATMELQRLIQEANTHRVSLYSMSSLSDRMARQISAEASAALSSEVRFSEMTAEILVHYLAGLSGGRTLVNGPQLAEQLREVAEERESLYSLAFTPPGSGDGEYHKIRVTVRRDKVKLRYRKGFLDVRNEDRIEQKTLAAAAFGAVDNPVGLGIARLEQKPQEDGKVQVDIIAALPMANLVLMPKRDSHEGKISLCVVIRDDKGGLSDVFREEFPVQVPVAQLETALAGAAGVARSLMMEPGPKVLAIGVRDELGGLEATFRQELAVGSGQS